MTCPTRQQPGIGLNVHVRSFKYCRQVGHVQVCPCAERTRKARNHLQPECFGCIRTHTYTNPYTHRYNFVIVAVAIQQAYSLQSASSVVRIMCRLSFDSCLPAFMFVHVFCCYVAALDVTIVLFPFCPQTRDQTEKSKSTAQTAYRNSAESLT